MSRTVGVAILLFVLAGSSSRAAAQLPDGQSSLASRVEMLEAKIAELRQSAYSTVPAGHYLDSSVPCDSCTGDNSLGLASFQQEVTDRCFTLAELTV